MIIPFYFIENSWCLLEIKDLNNTYWIDWNVLYDIDNIEIKDVNKINEDLITYTNILCIMNNKYYCYNTKNKEIYHFKDGYNYLIVDELKSLKSLDNLTDKYNEFLYKTDIYLISN